MDGIDSARTVVDAATGGIADQYSYDAFGAPGATLPPDTFLFAGQQYDRNALRNDFEEQETGLYYLRARYYDPELGRFLTRDPLPGSTLDPQSQNRYAYAGNNPVNRTDPTGLMSEGGGWEEFLIEQFVFQDCLKFSLLTAALVGLAVGFATAPLALPTLPLWLTIVATIELEVAAVATGGAAAGVGYSASEICTP
jgi:RHS repeat-associated protein